MLRIPTVEEVWPAVPRTRPRTFAEWARLSREIGRCRRCPLGALREHPVIHRGSLRPRVLFVGEAPGATEDHRGLPFVGASGKRLDQLVERLGLLESEFAVVNVIKCRPPGNHLTREPVEACRPFLARQVEFLQPIMLVTLGGEALAAFRPDLLPVTRTAGRHFRWRGLRFFPMIHPAAASRSGTFLRRWDRDGTTLASLLSRLGAVGNPAAGPSVPTSV
ncbi:MAG TPA: uracil-DNA glycosylase [Thermoplasmata archaeon]|nr:uracil-DNA glycosylase [Thermoplasmata archaeon]